MEIVRDLSQIKSHLRGGAVSIGNFDGVHLGHAALIEQLRRCADEAGGPAVVFTFDPHPVRVLRPDFAPPPLTWTSRKAELLEQLNVDMTLVYPTDMAMLELSPEDFFQNIIVDSLGAKALVEGPNFAFGRDRIGTIDLLQLLCNDQQIHLQVVPPCLTGEQYISSSRIRDAITQGDIDFACEMLTRPYRIRGMVTHGRNRATAMGFPTANLDAIDTLVPAAGVYAGIAWVKDKPYASAIHIGPNPTFAEVETKFEVHLLDFQEMIYGQILKVDMISRVRDIRTFEDPELLQAQLKLDIEQVRQRTQPWNQG